MSLADLQQDNGEVVFAQKLASGNPVQRARAMNTLKQWLSARLTNKHKLSPLDASKLCKGLYYAMWQQDKPLVQEQLADDICALIALLHPDTQQFMLMLRAMVHEMSAQWTRIDQWRMDKMMMLVRRLLRTCLGIAAQLDWDDAFVEELLQLLQDTALSPTDEGTPAGLKYHVVSIYLDELDLAAATAPLNDAQLDRMLLPFEAIVLEPKAKDVFVDTVLKEIYETILMSYVEENMEEEEDGVEEEEEGDAEQPETSAQKGVQFNYSRIASRLFHVGADKRCLSRRRNQLYALVKRFRAAAAGQNPFDDECLPETDGKMKKKEVDQAVRRLASRMLVPRNDKRKLKRQHKQTHVVAKKPKRDQAHVAVAGKDKKAKSGTGSKSSKGVAKRKNKKAKSGKSIKKSL